MKSLNKKKKKLALIWFCYLNRKNDSAAHENLLRWTYQGSSNCHTQENSKMFNITSKYFSSFNNTIPTSWVAHITTDFLTLYSCSYYRIIVPFFLYILSFILLYLFIDDFVDLSNFFVCLLVYFLGQRKKKTNELFENNLKVIY